MKGLITHDLIALFIYNKETNKYFRIKKSTELTISMNPEDDEKEYCADKNPSKELKYYNPEIEQPLTMLKGEADFEFFFDMFFKQATGDEAKTKCMVVFMSHGTKETGYKAWETDCLVEMNELNSYDSELSFNINFAGDTTTGIATMVDGEPIFTADNEGEGIDE